MKGQPPLSLGGLQPTHLTVTVQGVEAEGQLQLIRVMQQNLVYCKKQSHVIRVFPNYTKLAMLAIEAYLRYSKIIIILY